MKKVFFSLIALAITIVIAGPYFAGKQAKISLDSIVAHIEKMNSSNKYSVKFESYERSWFETHAVVLIQWKEFEESDKNEHQVWELPLKLHIGHGPILLDEKPMLGWYNISSQFSTEDENTLREFVRVEGEGPTYLLTGHMNLMGNMHIKDRLLPLVYEKDGKFMEVNGYSGEGHIQHAKVLEYTMQTPSIRTKSEDSDFNMSVGELQFHTDDLYSFVSSGIGSFSTTYSIPIFESTSEGWQFENTMSSYVVKVNDETESLSAVLDIKADLVVFEKEKLEALSARFTYDNISTAFVENIQSALKEQSEGKFTQDSFEDRMIYLMMTQLLPASPVLSMEKLSFVHSSGAANGQFTLTVDGDRLEEAVNSGSLSIDKPEGLISYIKMNGQLESDKSFTEFVATKYMIREMERRMSANGVPMTPGELNMMAGTQVPSILQMLETQDFIVGQGDQYQVQASFQNSTLAVNGKELPLPF